MIQFINKGGGSNKIILPDGIKFYYSSFSDLDFLGDVDSSNITNASNMFANCSNLTVLPNWDFKNVTNGMSMFNSCTQIVTIPQYDFSKLVNAQGIFRNCTKLETVPVFDMKNVENNGAMFTDSSALTNESLNNILNTCITMTKISTSSKTLKSIGLSSAQATTCQGLSNYSDFVAAGWTTGY